MITTPIAVLMTLDAGQGVARGIAAHAWQQERIMYGNHTLCAPGGRCCMWCVESNPVSTLARAGYIVLTLQVIMECMTCIHELTFHSQFLY